jgi:predicted ester cyclase
MWSALPDGRWRLDLAVAAGDVVAARSTFAGTQTGMFDDVAPTSRRVEVTFSDFYRLRDGLVVAHWHDFDLCGLLEQLR